MKLLILTAFIITQYIFVLPYFHSAFAADYSISYNIQYNIQQDGTTLVDYNIKLSNLNDSLFAASESLTTTQTDISNISVVSTYGIKQAYDVTKTDNATTITTTFTNPAVGQGSSDQWDIRYKTKQITESIGHTWNIFVPGFGDKQASNINSIQIGITVPKNFGDANFSSPAPSSISSDASTTKYTFNDDKINASGINMILGPEETYSFTFNYPVSNNTNDTQVYTIAVPPDTATQKINFTNINPKPDTFTINNDGDYILSYKLNPHTTGVLNVQGIATVASTYNLLNNKNQAPVYLSSSDQATYTKEMKYWQISNPTIKNLAASLTKGETSNTTKAKSIYDYVVKTFKYNKNALYDTNRDRKGALYALQNPTDVICQEYVDAFVALARSAGVPAIFDAGYGNTLSPSNNLPPNVLHAWAEYYDPSYGWVPVDPTWESTSGSNFFGNVGSTHFTLAKYGHDSENPILVLAFIANKNSDNNIKLAPSNEAFVNNLNYTINQDNKLNINGGFSNDANIQVENTGNRVIYLSGGDIDFNNNTYSADKGNSTQYLFPSMTGNVVLPINSGTLLTKESYDGKIITSYATYPNLQPLKKTFNVSISITPVWFLGLIPVLAVVLIFVISYTLVNLIIKAHTRFANK